jgi:hypothetical protein
LLGYSDSKWNSITVDRMDNNRGYEANNMCLACFKCNNMKRAFFSYDEWQYIAKTFIVPRLGEYHTFKECDGQG